MAALTAELCVPVALQLGKTAAFACYLCKIVPCSEVMHLFSSHVSQMHENHVSRTGYPAWL